MQQRKVYWPLFFYFYCKYSLWFGVISFNLVMNVTTKISCQALVRVCLLSRLNPTSLCMNGTQFTFGQLAINTAGGSAVTLLMLRTIAVWNRAPLVVVSLTAASLGLWSLLLYNIASIRGSWNDAIDMCVTTSGISGLMGLIIFMYGESCMAQNDMLNTNVEYSDVV